MPTVLGKESLWDRWKHNVTHGWGNAPGAIIGGITGKGIQKPTVKNGAIEPHSPAASAGNVIGDTGKFFEALVNPQTWVRVGEVGFGVILLIVGVDHMFGSNIGPKMAAKLV